MGPGASSSSGMCKPFTAATTPHKTRSQRNTRTQANAHKHTSSVACERHRDARALENVQVVTNSVRNKLILGQRLCLNECVRVRVKTKTNRGKMETYRQHQRDLVELHIVAINDNRAPASGRVHAIKLAVRICAGARRGWRFLCESEVRCRGTG